MKSESPQQEQKAIAERLKLALSLVEEVSPFIRNYFCKVSQVEKKDDGTVVTMVDREVERRLREEIEKRFHQDNVIGEEFPSKLHQSQAQFTWTVDPIDGTTSFVRGVPLFGTLLGLLQGGKAVMGVAHFPMLQETVYASKDQGCFWRPMGQEHFQEARVSMVGQLSEALCCYSGREYFARSEHLPLYERLGTLTGLERSWGDCYGHMLVATGRAEVMVDPLLKIWDIAPFQVIIQEAGGKFFNFQKNDELNIQGVSSGISCNQLLWQKIDSWL